MVTYKVPAGSSKMMSLSMTASSSQVSRGSLIDLEILFSDSVN